ncbi:hypothetical protein [Jiangella aurantiaca]|nr:hypothetical protein [Jiangella aurantiaca]
MRVQAVTEDVPVTRVVDDRRHHQDFWSLNTIAGVVTLQKTS